jgi:penicillin-binding protein 1A
MPRVLVRNVSDGGLVYWLIRLYALALLALTSGVMFIAFGVYLHFSRQLPPLPDLATYARSAPGTTTLFAQDGSILGEFATERREIVPFDQIPQPLIDAFVSTEDRRFFSHGGLDVRGLLRAFAANLRAGQVLQGGSTITQQVAKAFLSPERSLSRKIKEAIFARRLEARYRKREILALYLNHIFLGAGAYGVEAASRRYFDKTVSELNLGEMALLGGLARAPSRDSPLVDLDAARERRATVLDNMAETGAISRPEADLWKKAPLNVHPRRDYFHEVTPYFSEQVRRDLIKRYGQKAFYEGGFRVETSVVPYLDVLAQENVDVAARKLDKRQGWRGPEARLDETRAQEFIRRATALYGGRALTEGRLYLGIVERAQPQGALVRVGARTFMLPLGNMAWASTYSATDGTNDKTIESATAALRRGDVIWVRWAFRSRVPRFTEFTYNEEGEASWVPEQAERKAPKVQELELEQTPKVQASIYSFDHRDGYVLAMAGGDDFDRSEFNCATQACRQPGSAYKPIYYSLALDRGYAYSTTWNDKPRVEVDPVTGEKTVMQNVDGSYSQQVTLERALVWSKNPPSSDIFQILGAHDVEAWSRRLGMSTPLITSPECERKFCSALALGASCVKLDELTRAFAVFARNGRPIAPVSVRRIVDRQGHVIEDHTAPSDPWIDAPTRLDRVAAVAGVQPEPVIDPRTAWLTSKLLREIVTQGHSGPIRATKVVSAGKTGTSSRTHDVWFVGYTSSWMTTAWIGSGSDNRELGYKDASFMLSVPMWARYMAAAVGDQPLDEIPWERPPSVKAQDTGGPLKKGFAPPPAPGLSVDGKPLELAPKLKDAKILEPGAEPPPNLVRPKIVRVPGAAPPPPTPPKGER